MQGEVISLYNYAEIVGKFDVDSALIYTTPLGASFNMFQPVGTWRLFGGAISITATQEQKPNCWVRFWAWFFFNSKWEDI